VRPYFVLEGNICALLATKDDVNVFLYDGAIVPDPEGIITGGHDNQTAPTVAIAGATTDTTGQTRSAGGWDRSRAPSFGHRAADVGPGGRRAQVEPCGDLLVAESRRDERHHLALAASEILQHGRVLWLLGSDGVLGDEPSGHAG
jgi:hypothetical protein